MCFSPCTASQIGSAIEVALLSLALADRINAMRELAGANPARCRAETGSAMNQQLERTATS
jgi:two-component system, sensor histidine kinase LadS